MKELKMPKKKIKVRKIANESDSDDYDEMLN